MRHLENYRPFLTEHLVFDFPSHFSLKEIQNFTQNDMTKTIFEVNDEMKKIMNNETGYWYTSEKITDKIISKLSIKNLNYKTVTTTVNVDTVEDLDKNLKVELFKKIYDIVSVTFEIESFELNTSDETLISLFRKKYSINDKGIYEKKGI